MSSDYLCRAEKINKSFGATRALVDVDIHLSIYPPRMFLLTVTLHAIWFNAQWQAMIYFMS